MIIAGETEKSPIDALADSSPWNQVGIGQRGFLVSTSHGTIIWDIVCFLDQHALDHIARTYAPIVALVISHPHFYTTWPDWARSLACPIYLAHADIDWLARQPGQDIDLRLLGHGCTPIMPGIQALVTGGHFPGSTMLYATRTDGHGVKANTLFHADTIHIVPSGKNPDSAFGFTSTSSLSAPDVEADPAAAAATYAFMWSVPNMIPLSPAAIEGIWTVMKTAKVDHAVSHGLLDTVRLGDRARSDQSSNRNRGRGRLIERALLSMQIAVKAMGYTDHPLLREVVDW